MIRRMFIFFILLNSFALSGYAKDLNKDEALSKFQSAVSAYRQEKYDEAIHDLETIIQGGWESGIVYYNLGSCYLKQGNQGKAVLFYERAKRLMPRDHDLKFNWRYVTEKITNFPPENWIERSLCLFSLDEWVLYTTILIFLLSSFHLLSLFLRWPVRLRRIGLIGLALIFIASVFFVFEKINYEKDWAVVLMDADSKFEPRNDATVYFKLAEGMKVKILTQDEGWVKIKRSDGKLGWVHQDNLEKI